MAMFYFMFLIFHHSVWMFSVSVTISEHVFFYDFTIQVTLISKCIALIFNLENIPGVQERV
jgi:hypothetical protein